MKNKKTLLNVCRTGALVGAMLLLTSCLGSNMKVRTFTLDPLSRQRKPQVAKPTVAFGKVELPAYLEGAPMAKRVGKHEMHLSDEFVWVEPLRDAFPLCLEENLRRSLGVLDVERSPVALDRYDRVIDVKVIEFAQSASGPVVLDVLCRIKTSENKQLSIVRKTYRVDVADATSYESLAAAHSKAVASLGDDLAAALLKLE